MTDDLIALAAAIRSAETQQELFDIADRLGAIAALRDRVAPVEADLPGLGAYSPIRLALTAEEVTAARNYGVAPVEARCTCLQYISDSHPPDPIPPCPVHQGSIAGRRGIT